MPCQPWLVGVTGEGRHRISAPVNMIAAQGISWTPDSRELVIPYLCDPAQVCSESGDCDAKTFLRGLRAIDLQTGQTRTVVKPLRLRRRGGPCHFTHLRHNRLRLEFDRRLVDKQTSARRTGRERTATATTAA